MLRSFLLMYINVRKFAVIMCCELYVMLVILKQSWLSS